MEQRTRIDSLHGRLSGWLCDAAYPLWSTRGVDRERGGFHERLDQRGEPLLEPRRARVQPRQVYAFAMAPSLGWRGDAGALAHRGLEYLIARHRRPDGLFRTLIGPDGAPLDERALLYDQAFALLGFVLAASLGGDARAEREAEALNVRELLLKNFKRQSGGYETEMPARLPLQSNPHMHLFEALLAASEICAECSPWNPLADEIAELALTRFIAPQDGALREFFDDGWAPASGIEGRLVEPGHQFEWAWLLLRWAGERQPKARAAALRLIDIGEQHGVRDGLAVNCLLDDFSVHDAGARLWPQTERLKAAALAARLTGEGRYHDMAASAAEGILRYLDTPVRGLWFDRIDEHGKMLDEPAPASSFYHLVAAIAEFSALARLA